MTVTAPSQKLDFGRVIRTTFGGLQQSLGRLLPLIGLLIVLPSAFTLASSLSRGGVLSNGYAFSPLYFVNLIVGVVAWTAFQAAGIQVLVAGMGGGSVDLKTSLRRSLAHILPLLAILLLYVLAVWIGSILFLVPGIMIAVAFSAAIPVRVMENAGVFQAFGRSRDLTRGNRWRITGLLLIYMVGFGVIEFALIGVFGGLASVSKLSSGGAIGLTIALQIFGLVVGLIGLSGGCSLYVELRRIKGAAAPDELAAVFD